MGGDVLGDVLGDPVDTNRVDNDCGDLCSEEEGDPEPVETNLGEMRCGEYDLGEDVLGEDVLGDTVLPAAAN